jgi:hypothetical protein
MPKTTPPKTESFVETSGWADAILLIARLISFMLLAVILILLLYEPITSFHSLVNDVLLGVVIFALFRVILWSSLKKSSD